MGKLVRQLGTIERDLEKREILALAKENGQAVIDSGKYDLLKVYIELKRYESYLKGLIQHLKKPALEKASEKGQKSFQYDNAKLNISRRTKWDFSVDEQWSRIDEQIQQLTQEKKEREKHLKESNKVRRLVDEETGEVIEDFELPKEIKFGLSVRL